MGIVIVKSARTHERIFKLKPKGDGYIAQYELGTMYISALEIKKLFGETPKQVRMTLSIETNKIVYDSEG